MLRIFSSRLSPFKIHKLYISSVQTAYSKSFCPLSSLSRKRGFSPPFLTHANSKWPAKNCFVLAQKFLSSRRPPGTFLQECFGTKGIVLLSFRDFCRRLFCWHRPRRRIDSGIKYSRAGKEFFCFFWAFIVATSCSEDDVCLWKNGIDIFGRTEIYLFYLREVHICVVYDQYGVTWLVFKKWKKI